MVPFLIVGGIIGVITTVLAAVFGIGAKARSRRGRAARWLRSKRHGRWLRSKKEVGKVVTAHRATPAARMRQARKNETLGVFLRKRRPGDERKTRKLTTAATGHAKSSWANWRSGRQQAAQIRKQTRLARQADLQAARERQEQRDQPAYATLRQLELTQNGTLTDGQAGLLRAQQAHAAGASTVAGMESAYSRAQRRSRDIMGEARDRDRAIKRMGRCGKPTADGTACQRKAGVDGDCGVKHRTDTPLPGYGPQ